MQTRSVPGLRSLLRLIVFGILGALLLWMMVVYLPPGVDWETYYRPAALALLAGIDPYAIQGFFSPHLDFASNIAVGLVALVNR